MSLLGLEYTEMQFLVHCGDIVNLGEAVVINIGASSF